MIRAPIVGPDPQVVKDVLERRILEFVTDLYEDYYTADLSKSCDAYIETCIQSSKFYRELLAAHIHELCPNAY